MSKLTILEYPDPRLRTVAKPVTRFDAQLQTLIDDMAETMYAARGIGLAATQVDHHLRLLVLDVSESRDALQVFINPELLDRSGTLQQEEGCLSVPEIYAEVKRAETVTVRAQDASGEHFEQQLDGLAAICLQHEMDHLQGRLFVDYLSPIKRDMLKKKLARQRRQPAESLAAGS